MKVYYSWFAYTVVLIAGILMTICSSVLIFLTESPLIIASAFERATSFTSAAKPAC